MFSPLSTLATDYVERCMENRARKLSSLQLCWFYALAKLIFASFVSSFGFYSYWLDGIKIIIFINYTAIIVTRCFTSRFACCLLLLFFFFFLDLNNSFWWTRWTTSL